MVEVLESAFAIQKRGDRWCLFHRESGIMHERNFAHKGMAKAFGLELTEQGYVPEGAARVAAMVSDEPPPEGPVAGEGEVEKKPLDENDVLSVDEEGTKEEWPAGAPPDKPKEKKMPHKGTGTYKSKPRHKKPKKKSTKKQKK